MIGSGSNAPAKRPLPGLTRGATSCSQPAETEAVDGRNGFRFSITQRSRRRLAAAFGLLGWAAVAQAQPATTANTLDDTGGALAGQPMAGLVVMGKSCTFGDIFHYQVTSLGELRLEGPISCPAMVTGSKVNGNELLCRLDPKLRCTVQRHGAPAPVDYAVDDGGVTVDDNKVHGWADQQQAAALLLLVRQRGEKKEDR